MVLSYCRVLADIFRVRLCPCVVDMSAHSWTVQSADAREHHKANECPNRLVTCSECDLLDKFQGIPQRYMVDHKFFFCGAKLVTCVACGAEVSQVVLLDVVFLLPNHARLFQVTLPLWLLLSSPSYAGCAA